MDNNYHQRNSENRTIAWLLLLCQGGYGTQPGYPFAILSRISLVDLRGLYGRDRYISYVQARRFATNGGLVICDRFPLPQIKIMDGPQVERVTVEIKTQSLDQITRCPGAPLLSENTFAGFINRAVG